MDINSDRAKVTPTEKKEMGTDIVLFRGDSDRTRESMSIVGGRITKVDRRRNYEIARACNRGSLRRN